MLAVEAVLVEIDRRAVGGGHHRYALLEQVREQPRQDHRIGAVGHHHLVKGEQPRFLGQRTGKARDRIALLLGAFDGEALVHLQHEFGKMHAPFPADIEAGVEQVHQHRFAAPDPAPQIKATGWRGLAAQRSPQGGTTLGCCLQRRGEIRQPPRRRRLFRIGLELARREQRIIALEDVGHLSPLGA